MLRLIYNPLVLLISTLVVALATHLVIAKDRRPPLLIWLLRALLGVVFLLSGLSKLWPVVPNVIGPVQLVEVLTPHGLAFFARFIALSEALVGALLLIPRLTTLGALMFFPMLTCILVVTISLHWRGTPIVNSVLLGFNVALLAYDYPKIAPIFRPRPG